MEANASSVSVEDAALFSTTLGFSEDDFSWRYGLSISCQGQILDFHVEEEPHLDRDIPPSKSAFLEHGQLRRTSRSWDLGLLSYERQFPTKQYFRTGSSLSLGAEPPKCAAHVLGPLCKLSEALFFMLWV